MPKQRNVELSKPAVKDLRAISSTHLAAIKATLVELSTNPVLGKPLKGELEGRWRVRVGAYRIVYRFDEQTILILSIRHRKDVYR